MSLNCLSKIFQPQTLGPVGAEIKNITITSKSQKLLQTLGLVRSANQGTSFLLPLGVRSLKKLENLVHHEMKKISAFELHLPFLSAASLWEKTNRSNLKELYKLTDRYNHEYILSPTAEETIVNFIASDAAQSYKKYPLRLYQISRKFRDEMKPRFGLIRSKEFVMKDLYCFDINHENAVISYNEVVDSYHRIFHKLEVNYAFVKGCTGDIGGTLSHEFHFPADIGDDKLIVCSACGESENSALNSTKQCRNCNSTNVSFKSGIEVGHTFLLGTKYTEPLQAVYLSQNTKKQYLHMSCYGLGLTRIIAAAVEVLSSTNEARWPKAIVPFTFCIILPKLGSKEESASPLGYNLYEQLNNSFTDDVIIDDRNDLTIGKRIVEAKMFGYPYILVVGRQAMLDPPVVELHDVYNGQVNMLEVDNIMEYIQKETSEHAQRTGGEQISCSS